jgi:hypothetical protein
MILYTYKEKGRISMNIRIRQIEKARRMIDNGMAKKKAVAFASRVKEITEPQLETCFTTVSNAFLSIGKAADCAGKAILNLVPNLYI